MASAQPESAKRPRAAEGVLPLHSLLNNPEGDPEPSPSSPALPTPPPAAPQTTELAQLKQRLAESEAARAELEKRQQLSVAQISAHTELLGRLLDVVVVLDMEGAIGFVNPACYQLLGYSKKELLGRTLQELLMEGSRETFVLETRNRLLAQSQRALSSSEQFSVLYLARKDGSQVAVEARGQAWQRPREGSVEIVLTLRELSPASLALRQDSPPGMDVDRSPYWARAQPSGLSPLMGDVRLNTSPVASATGGLSALVNVAAGERREQAPPQATASHVAHGMRASQMFRNM